MRINVKIDCTPVEARTLMGLPDLTPLHEQYLETLRDTMTNGVSPDFVEGVLKSWSSTGEAGFEFLRKLMLEGGRKA